MGEGSLRVSEGTSVGVVPGPSCAPPSGCGRSSTKKKVADFSRCFRSNFTWMRRLFFDRQFSPSAGMDRSEW
jgi:hypothetical protein